MLRPSALFIDSHKDALTEFRELQAAVETMGDIQDILLQVCGRRHRIRPLHDRS
jgi:hypothetical protein